MDRGDTIILFNIDNLHESLYDVLNQSFYNLGVNKQEFVDLGLGFYRVPAHVHPDFQ